MVVTEDTDCIAWDPQSVCIPDGVTIEIHDLCYYQGDTKTVDASVECFPTEG
jgi:hypothetical protein